LQKGSHKNTKFPKELESWKRLRAKLRLTLEKEIQYFYPNSFPT
jgi:hypothetical protein